MRQFIVLTLLLGCGSGDKTETADTSSEADTDTDTDTDTDADADTDSDTDADPTSHLRVIHVAPGHGPMDMIVNATLPPTLNALAYQDGTPWTDRQIDSFNFQFMETGQGLAGTIVEFDMDLLADTHHTFAIAGMPPNTQVLRFVDDPNGIFPMQIRLRWTHAAIGLGQLDVMQMNGGVVHAVDLDFGDTLVEDFDSGPMTIGVDATDDGLPEWTFQDFDLDPNTMVDIYIVNDCDGCTPYLTAHLPAGLTPIREVLADTGADTGGIDTSGPDTSGTDTGADTGP